MEFWACPAFVLAFVAIAVFENCFLAWLNKNKETEEPPKDDPNEIPF